jgi:ATP/maltotriose-dependent transcriptional regulator MalT
LLAAAEVLRAEGRPAEALEAVRETLEPETRLSPRHPFAKQALIHGVEAAFEAGDTAAVEDLLGEWERMSPVDRTPFLEGHRARFEARLGAARGETEIVEPSLRRAAGLFRSIAMPFYEAVALLEHSEWLAGRGRADEARPLLADARATFDRLRAKPWLERLAALELGEPVSA